jgi:hypothetical protein
MRKLLPLLLLALPACAETHRFVGFTGTVTVEDPPAAADTANITGAGELTSSWRSSGSYQYNAVDANLTTILVGDLDAFRTAWGDTPLTDLDGTELTVGQTLTGSGILEANPVTVTFVIEKYSKPAPLTDGEDTSFLTVSVAASAGAAMASGTIDFALSSYSQKPCGLSCE